MDTPTRSFKALLEPSKLGATRMAAAGIDPRSQSATKLIENVRNYGEARRMIERSLTRWWQVADLKEIA